VLFPPLLLCCLRWRAASRRRCYPAPWSGGTQDGSRRPRSSRQVTSRSPSGHGRGRLPDGIAPRPEDYVFLKRRPSAFYGTGVAELLHMLRRDTIIIGGGATNRGVETSVREAFNFDLASVVVRECCWSGDTAAHAYSLDKAMKMYARIRTLDQVAAMLRE
jgi:nicotinamidase-related amidase